MGLLDFFRKFLSDFKWREPRCYRTRLRGDLPLRAALVVGLWMASSGGLLMLFALVDNPPPMIWAYVVGVLIGPGTFVVMTARDNSWGWVYVRKFDVYRKAMVPPRFRDALLFQAIGAMECSTWPYGAIGRCTLIPSKHTGKRFAVMLLEDGESMQIIGVPRKIDLKKLARHLMSKGVQVKVGESVPAEFVQPIGTGIPTAAGEIGAVMLVFGLIVSDGQGRQQPVAQQGANAGQRARFNDDIDRDALRRAGNFPKPPTLDQETRRNMMGPSPFRQPGGSNGGGANDANENAKKKPSFAERAKAQQEQARLAPSQRGGGMRPGGSSRGGFNRGGPSRGGLNRGGPNRAAMRRNRSEAPAEAPPKDEPENAGFLPADDPPPAPRAMMRPRPSLRADNRDDGLIGGTGGVPFKTASPNGRPLLGVRYTMGSWAGEPALRSLTPIFDRRRPAGAKAVVARAGYAVGGMNVHAPKYASAIQLVFMRVGDDGRLDPSDSYTSDWIGKPAGGPPEKLDGGGRKVVGIKGRRAAVLDAVGLVLE